LRFLKKLIAISILSTTTIFAINLKELKEIPKSVERDFYIWEYLKEKNTTIEGAIEASKLIFRVNAKLNSAFRAKTSLELPKRKYTISKSKINRYNTLLKRLKEDKSIYEGWLKLPTYDMLLFFNLAGKENRKLLNKSLKPTTYSKLTKYYAINQFIYRVFSENLNNLKETILTTRPVKGNKISYKNLLKIGFINLKLNREKEASYFFYSAMLKAKDRFNADRAIFWLYMATKKDKFIKRVAKSYDYNIYKLIALDFLNLSYPKPKVENIKDIKSKIDITSPIEWARLKQKIFSKNIDLKNLAKEYKTKESAAFYYYIMQKASRYKDQYFPILYREYLKKYPIDRQALILAIARQESHFIPSSISTSFALGLMQFMPFLVKDIAKKRGDDIKLEDMFKPKKAIEYANYHLNYLQKYLYNPLFIAYAYNAGIGYTRRMIRKNIFKNGKYEPYLSIELVDNQQANHYAKKVLANYVIYKMLLGSPIKITKIIQELTNPKLTDKFRIQR